jgi:hypothetical protein
MIILQYEGAYLNDGKGLSDWDVLTHETPGDYDDDNESLLYTLRDSHGALSCILKKKILRGIIIEILLMRSF